jgi:hypothetical protein
MTMNYYQWDDGTGGIKVLREALPHCQSVYHKSHFNWPLSADQTLAAEHRSFGRALSEAAFV